MSTILSLDTSTKVCSLALHKEGQLVGQQSYHLQKSHSNLLPVVIQQLIENCETNLSDLTAIALSAGPGSYTGLRIGTATAKGLCFSLGIPLIALDSLDSMIEQMIPMVSHDAFFCPMIDARRMEVYCKVVSREKEHLPTQPLIVDDDGVFDQFLDQPFYLFGNGSDKLRDIFISKEFHFISGIHPLAAFMGKLAHEKLLKEDFEDLAYFEPDYLKEYRTNTPSQKFKV